MHLKLDIRMLVRIDQQASVQSDEDSSTDLKLPSLIKEENSNKVRWFQCNDDIHYYLTQQYETFSLDADSLKLRYSRIYLIGEEEFLSASVNCILKCYINFIYKSVLSSKQLI